MGKSSPSAPAAPDPVATAKAQGAVNKDTAIAQAYLNNTNQNTPWGSLTFQQNGTSPDGTTPTFSSTVNLSPEQQKILDYQQQGQMGLGKLAANQVGAVQNSLGQSFPQNLPGIKSNVDYSQAGSLPQSAGDFQSLADQSIAATRGLMNPQLDRQQEMLNSQLANQGVLPGSEAYTNAQRDFGLQKNNADLQAVQAGQQQANTAYGQGLASHQQLASELSGNANLQNSANQQDLSQQSFLRDMPLNEYSALASGSQVSAPQFSNPGNAGQMQSPNLAQLYQNQYLSQQNSYNQGIGQQNSAMSGLFGLGGAAISAFSDKRLKTSIKRIGKTPMGLNVYEFRYKGMEKVHTGVMAQEVERIMPDAVHTVNGFKKVNYAMVR